jgi:sugar porter (SP) family MFS transporter
MKSNKLLTWSITVALAGFLFGFDTIVISGADQPIQGLWKTSPLFHSTFIMSMALWGTVIGALFGGIPCNRLGRRNTLFLIGILYLISALGSGMAPNEYYFSFFRFIGGLGVGASSVAAPIYISEIAPADRRGRLVALYQFNIVFGILVAFLSNYFIGNYMGEEAWRWMLGVEAIPALIYVLMVINVPESPRWLILKKGNVEAGRSILQRIDPGADIEHLVEEIRESIHHKSEGLKTFYSGKYNRPIMLAFLLAFFNQLSGINFVLYYAPRIFESMGIDPDNVLAASVPIGVVNLLFTLVGMYLIDRLGRRQLMTIGSIGYITFLLGVAWAAYTNATGILVVAFICGIYRFSCHRPGSGDLGIYFRDLSQ